MIALLYFLITFAIMAVSILLIYRAARFFGLQVDRRALILCAVMAVGVNFASIYLSNILTLDHLMVIIGLVLLSAALMTLLNEYLLRRHAPVLAGAEGALAEEEMFSAEDEEEAPGGLLAASLAAVGASAATALSPPETEARAGMTRERVLAEVVPLALVEEARADTASPEEALFSAERPEEEKVEVASPEEEARVAVRRAEDAAPDGGAADVVQAVEGEAQGDAPPTARGGALTEEEATAPTEDLSARAPSLSPDEPRKAHVPRHRRLLRGLRSGKRRCARLEHGVRREEPARSACPAPAALRASLPKAPPVGVELARLTTLDDHLAYASKKRGEGNGASAVLAYQQALGKFRQDPYAPFIVMELGNLYKENGDYAEAVSAYHSALRLAAVKARPMMAAEFQKNIAYLDTVLLVLSRRRMPNTPFSQIPPDCHREIERDFAARQPKNINA
ncbi:MAG: hypothetical protein ACTTJE_09790 [Schwartzia sp. (in: firmicutes)]